MSYCRRGDVLGMASSLVSGVRAPTVAWALIIVEERFPVRRTASSRWRGGLDNGA